MCEQHKPAFSVGVITNTSCWNIVWKRRVARGCCMHVFLVTFLLLKFHFLWVFSTQVNMMFVVLLWVCIHTGKAETFAWPRWDEHYWISIRSIRSKLFWGSIRPDPPIHAWYMLATHIRSCRSWLSRTPLIYYLTERSLFKKSPPPHRKILKKGPGQYIKSSPTHKNTFLLNKLYIESQYPPW
jgi:hypothetical protein